MEEYCWWEKFNATCGPESAIIMADSKFGRMKVGRCAHAKDDAIGCQKVNCESGCRKD